MPTLSLSEVKLIEDLSAKLREYRLKNRIRENFYTGQDLLQNLNISTVGPLAGVTQSVGWAKTAVDSLNDRISLQGWVDDQYGLNKDFDDNSLAEEANLAHRDALVFGCGFLVVGKGDPSLGEPETLITAENPNFTTAVYDLRKRRPVAALQLFDEGVDAERGTLFTEWETIPFRVSNGKYYADGERWEHGFGRPPVVMLVNNRRSGSSLGKSEITFPMRAIISSVVRTMLGAEVAREFYSVPQKYALGAPMEFFKDPVTGETVNPLRSSISSMWILPGLQEPPTDVRPQKGGKYYNPTTVGQFTANSPTAFTELIKMYAQLFASEAVIPEYYLGFNTTNPTSADAIRAGEYRLIKRASQKVNTFSRAWSEVGHLVMLNKGPLPEDYEIPKASWADVSTISPSAAADRALKLVSAGILQPTSEMVLKELGFSRAEIEIIRAENTEAQAQGVLGLLRQNAAGASQAAQELPTNPEAQRSVSDAPEGL